MAQQKAGIVAAAAEMKKMAKYRRGSNESQRNSMAYRRNYQWQ